MEAGRAEPDLATLIDAAQRGFAARIAAALRDAGHDQATPAWGAVFRAMARGRLTLTALADALGVVKQSVSRVVNDMESAGYLERLPSLSDRRAKLLVLTSRGRDAAALIARVGRDLEREMAAAAGGSGAEGLRRALAVAASPRAPG